MKIVVRLFLIAAVLAGLWFAMQALLTKQQDDLARFAAQPRPLSVVEVEQVKQEQWQRYLYSIGTFTAINDTIVTSEVDGKITKIHFTSGQTVKRGDLLVSLDTKVDHAQLRALQAEQQLQDLQFERSKKLLRKRTISKSDFDISAARRDEAIAMVEAQQAALDLKEIRAPFDGILGLRSVDIGEYLQAGDKIANLQSVAPIYVDFGTPERYLRNAAVGLPLEAKVHAYGDEIFHGEIVALEPGVDRSSRNMFMRGRFDNGDRRLRPGMFAEIRGILPQADDVLTVPETAVSYTPYGNSVFIVEAGDGGDVVTRVTIETGDIRNGRVAVKSGLDEGSRFVSAGHNKLRNGMRVEVKATEAFTSAAQ